MVIRLQFLFDAEFHFAGALLCLYPGVELLQQTVLHTNMFTIPATPVDHADAPIFPALYYNPYSTYVQ